MPYVSNNDIQICILCMVQVIDGAGFGNIKLMSEIGHQPCLNVDDLCIGIELPEKRCNDLR